MEIQAQIDGIVNLQEGDNSGRLAGLVNTTEEELEVF